MIDEDLKRTLTRTADEAIACNRKIHELAGTVQSLRLKVDLLRARQIPVRAPWLALVLACVALAVSLAALLH